MTTFQERIKQTLARAPNGPSAPFDQVLDEFVEVLKEAEEFLGAAIEKGSHPQMRSFVTWPRYRRNERSIMLTFWWEGTTMKVVNEKDRPPFATPEALREYLLDFLTNSAFPSTLAEYAERCKEDLDGFLRTESLVDASPKDVMVLVSAADQATIAMAQPGARIDLRVETQHVPGTTDYDPSAKYAYLLSGGYGLLIDIHNPTKDGKIYLSGRVMPIGVTK